MIIANDRVRQLIRDTLDTLPAAIVEQVLSSCLFASVSDPEAGFLLPASVIQGRSLILLSDAFVEEATDREIQYLIAHEIAHLVLGHDPSTTDEDAAHQLVKAWWS